MQSACKLSNLASCFAVIAPPQYALSHKLSMRSNCLRVSHLRIAPTSSEKSCHGLQGISITACASPRSIAPVTLCLSAASGIMPPPFPWLEVYAWRVSLALSIRCGRRAMRSGFLSASFQRVQFPLLVSLYSLSCLVWFG